MKVKRRGSTLLAAFLASFRKSMKGNYWREFRGETLTAFFREGYWHWCVAGPAGRKEFSMGVFDSEKSALRSLARRFGIE
jgi:hypothetical protein